MFAYGSNLNLGQMDVRCPRATSLGRLKLEDWRLVFRGVADCVPEEGAVCYGGVWVITEECERVLDRYEGCRADGSGMYWKDYIPIEPCEHGDSMLVYRMNSEGIMPPSKYYFDVIRDGYRDFRMPKVAYRELDSALRASWDDKKPSHVERQRHRRNGRPSLALCKAIAR